MHTLTLFMYVGQQIKSNGLPLQRYYLEQNKLQKMLKFNEVVTLFFPMSDAFHRINVSYTIHINRRRHRRRLWHPTSNASVLPSFLSFTYPLYFPIEWQMVLFGAVRFFLTSSSTSE